MAMIIDGKAISAQIKDEVKEAVAKMADEGLQVFSSNRPQAVLY